MLASSLQNPVSHGRVRALFFTSLGHFINDGTVAFVPLIADLFAAQRHVTATELTVMFVVFSASSSILSAYVGRLADKTGKPGPLIGLGLVLLSFGLIGFQVSLLQTNSLILLVLLIGSGFLVGFGSAFYHPLGATVLQSAFEEKSRGEMLGLNGAGGSIGRALYPSLFFFVALLLTNNGSIGFFAAVGLIASASVWLGLRQNLKPALEQNRDSTANASSARDATTRGILMLTLIAFIRSFATQGILSWIPIYISTQKGVGLTSTLGLDLTIMYITAIIGQPFFGSLVDRFDKRLVLAVSSVGSAFSIVAYLFTSGVVEIAALSLFGFFTFTVFPLLLSLSSDYVPKRSASLGNALVWGLGTGGGGVIGPLVTGVIIFNSYSNLSLAFEIMALATLLSAFATGLIPKAGGGNRSVPAEFSAGNL